MITPMHVDAQAPFPMREWLALTADPARDGLILAAFGLPFFSTLGSIARAYAATLHARYQQYGNSRNVDTKPTQRTAKPRADYVCASIIGSQWESVRPLSLPCSAAQPKCGARREICGEQPTGPNASTDMGADIARQLWTLRAVDCGFSGILQRVDEEPDLPNDKVVG